MSFGLSCALDEWSRAAFFTTMAGQPKLCAGVCSRGIVRLYQCAMERLTMLLPEEDGTFQVSFLLLPEYSMMALLSGIEPLRVANRMAGREVFRWRLVFIGDEAARASNQLQLLQDEPLKFEGCTPKNLFVCASFNVEDYISAELVRWLQQLHRAGSVLGAIDTGSYLLAEAGLLKPGMPVTLHWEALPAFAEKYPQLTLTHELFEVGKDIITCAGGSSVLDLMLHIIQNQLGHEIAVKVCEQFIRSGIRSKGDQQRLDVSARLKLHDQRLIKAVMLMEQELENPLSTADIASQVHVSVRQLERLFKQKLQVSPAEYYLELRLTKARQLLENSDLSISAIGMICGFSSGSHFSRSYQGFYGDTPSELRKKAAGQ